MPTPNLIQATDNRPGVLFAGTLAGTMSTLVEGPVNKSTVVSTATLHNGALVPRTAHLFINKAGGGTAQIIEVELDAKESCVVEELWGYPLAPGDSVSGYGSAASVINVSIGGAVSS